MFDPEFHRLGFGEAVEAGLRWLESVIDQGECRILTNARCLSEGVDVPNLDAVPFLDSPHSQVDVVESVGRVMRRAKNKQYGYSILPVEIPAGVTRRQHVVRK